jgi:hypothetical protein
MLRDNVHGMCDGKEWWQWRCTPQFKNDYCLYCLRLKGAIAKRVDCYIHVGTAAEMKRHWLDKTLSLGTFSFDFFISLL